MTNKILVLSFLFALFVLVGCTQNNAPEGSKENPIEIALMPGSDIGKLAENADQLKKYLLEHTGLYTEISVPTSYVAVIESLGSKRSDVAVLSCMAYLLAKQLNNSKMIFTFTNKGNAFYKSQIIVHVDSKIKKIEDLNNKKIAYVDPVSASGHIMPAAFLAQNKIKPAETIFAGRHDSVVSMVYQKRVDAGATFYQEPDLNQPADARKLIKTQHPDVFEKVKILTLTNELPNEGFVVRNNFDEVVLKRFVDGLKKWIETEEGKKTLKALYSADGLVEADEEKYIQVRELLKSIGKETKDLF